jgi:hypothetical protein
MVEAPWFIAPSLQPGAQPDWVAHGCNWPCNVLATVLLQFCYSRFAPCCSDLCSTFCIPGVASGGGALRQQARRAPAQSEVHVIVLLIAQSEVQVIVLLVAQSEVQVIVLLVAQNEVQVTVLLVAQSEVQVIVLLVAQSEVQVTVLLVAQSEVQVTVLLVAVGV